MLDILKKYVKPGSSLLDAGCGTGLLTKTIDKTYKVTAIDTNDLSLSLTRKRKPRAVILKANIEKRLPFPAHSFGAMTLLDVLEHVDDNKALRQLTRVLKPGGIATFTVPAYPCLFSYWDILHQHKRRYTLGHMKNLLLKYGFSVTHASYFNTMLFPFILLIRLVKTFGQRKQTTDCYEMPERANTILMKLFRRETRFAVHHTIPFGLSLLVIAKKM